jgi:FO synthase
MPGTAAEILDDRIRNRICPDKIDTETWLEITATAHEVGINTTSTIMFGHQENIGDWATHLMKIRDLQNTTGGITEFIPLPFVSMESPMYRRGQARPGPTFREVLLMHAVSRLYLHPIIKNIQTSWVKLGKKAALSCLNAGANDLGGTLMDESISKSAGGIHGQEFHPKEMESFIRNMQRTPTLRDTLYNPLNRASLPNKSSLVLSNKIHSLVDSAYPVI